MNITSIPTLSFNKYSKIISQKTDNCEKQNSTELPKLCANQIYFTAGLTTKSDRIFDNIKSLFCFYVKNACFKTFSSVDYVRKGNRTPLN